VETNSIDLKLEDKAQRMISVLIATSFGNMTGGYEIRTLCIENGTRQPYLSGKWQHTLSGRAPSCIGKEIKRTCEDSKWLEEISSVSAPHRVKTATTL